MREEELSVLPVRRLHRSTNQPGHAGQTYRTEQVTRSDMHYDQLLNVIMN